MPTETTPPSRLGGWTHAQAIDLLLTLSAELPELQAELDGLEQTAVETAEALTLAWSKSYLAASGPQHHRHAVADAATTDERLAAKLADTLVRAQRRKIDTLQTRIGVGRTVIASLRAELELDRA